MGFFVDFSINWLRNPTLNIRSALVCVRDLREPIKPLELCEFIDLLSTLSASIPLRKERKFLSRGARGRIGRGRAGINEEESEKRVEEERGRTKVSSSILSPSRANARARAGEMEAGSAKEKEGSSPSRRHARAEEGAGRTVEKGAEELMRGGEVPAESGERKREKKKKESGERPYHSPPASLRNGIFSVARERYAEERKSPE